MVDTVSDSEEQLLNQSEQESLALRGYRLLNLLGEGSFAKVFKAEYTKSKKIVVQLACKVVDVSKASTDYAHRFLPRELDIIVRVTHPNIVHVHSIFQRRTKYYIFMRFCERGDLFGFVVQHGPIPEAQTRVWFKQVCLAIRYLHGMGIAHRDLKCENILITGNFNLKVADFGFARKVMDSAGKAQLCETYCGSLSYVSPEVLKGIPYNAKISDIWSLGVVLYIMLNKSMPFDDSNANQLYKMQLNSSWNYRSKIIDTLSEEVKQLLPHILEPVPEKRYVINQIVTSNWINMESEISTASFKGNKSINDKKTKTASTVSLEIPYSSATFQLLPSESDENAIHGNDGSKGKHGARKKSRTKKSNEKQKTKSPPKIKMGKLHDSHEKQHKKPT